MEMKKALIVVTNHTAFDDPKTQPTGLWLSELTHFYDVLKNSDIAMDIVSPKGGKVLIDERSLGRFVLNKATKSRHQDPKFMSLLENTKSLSDVDSTNYDILYFAGGHGAMWDFSNNDEINTLICEMYEGGKIISAVCHGVAALQSVLLSDGEYLIKGKKGTGFSYFDETIIGLKRFVPYNLELSLKEKGMLYSKAFFPLKGHVVVDGRLITGQNPNSTSKLAEQALQVMNKL